MFGMVCAVIGALILLATQRAFPVLNERFKTFASIGYFLLAGTFVISTLTEYSFMRNLVLNITSTRLRVRKK